MKNNGRTIINSQKQKRHAINAVCTNIVLAGVLFYIFKSNILIIVLPTIFMVDTLIVIEKIKQVVVKNGKEND